MRTHRLSSLVAVTLGLISFSAALSQPANSSATPGTRLKIGVALEGGGALGLAHIGVLQSLEDQHIPIDYLAGTSMGGLVGGLYALGKSPQQLEEIVRKQDWDFIIAGQTNYEDLSYRRKEDATAYPNLLEFGLKKGLSLPSGLNSGQGVSTLIDEQTLAYAHSGSFDDFPTPFRCVATNLVTAQPKVFDHGSIALALRSTMSIPGVFAPVRDGKDVYVDGGLLGNLPTDVVRSMGADIVIAVHLDITPTDPDEIRSMFSVLGHSIEAVIHANELRGIAGADLIINVELKDFNAMQYDKAQSIIARGKGAADTKSKMLSPYAMNDGDWNTYLARRKSREKINVPVPSFVEVRGAGAEATKELKAYLQPLVGKPVDPAATNTIMDRLTGTGIYESADFWLAEEEGETGLIVNVHEKSYAPPILQLGFVVDGSEPNYVTFTQSARLTLMDIAGFRSEWRTDVSVGNTYGLSSELYRPITPLSRWFVAPHGEVYDQGLRLFQKSKPVAFYRVDRAEAGFDMGFQPSRFTEIRGGYDIGYAKDNLNLGTPDFTSIEGRIGDTHASFNTDHTDDPVVPSKGYGVTTNFHWYDAYPGSINGLPAMDARLQFFLPVSQKGSVYATAEGGTSFGVLNTGTPLYFLGAPLRLSAYGTNELYGDQYYLFRVGYLHNLFALPPFVGKNAYLVSDYEFAKMYAFAGPESGFPNDGTAGILIETALGPLYVGGSFGDSGHRKWFFQIGKAF
jgi:NTE family protein